MQFDYLSEKDNTNKKENGEPNITHSHLMERFTPKPKQVKCLILL